MATTKLYIVYYSLYGHVETMARAVQQGANAVQGVEATLWQTWLDSTAQFKAFFDATNELWERQALAGKPAGISWCTGFHGGGEELTALTAVTQLAHHDMIFVPLGYTFGSGMFEMNEVKGGSSYGTDTYAADGSREPTELELQQAFHQGDYIKTWRCRWFILKQGKLLWFKDPASVSRGSTPRGVVSVSDCLTVKGAEDIVNKAFAFELSTLIPPCISSPKRRKRKRIGSIGSVAPSSNIHAPLPIANWNSR
ncbi:hypothetical protein REPUB_Repub11eG0151200 [Reevesia pubescens]